MDWTPFSDMVHWLRVEVLQSLAAQTLLQLCSGPKAGLQFVFADMPTATPNPGKDNATCPQTSLTPE